MASNTKFGFKSKRYTSANIAELKRILCLGDRLEFGRKYGIGFVQPWRRGIYVGRYEDMEHAVIHLTTSGGAELEETLSIASAACQKPEIHANEINEIVRDSCCVRVNNSRDHDVTPLHRDAILKVAKIMHRGKAPMVDKLLCSNREHFVDLCRYDIDWSDQFDAANSSGTKSNWYTCTNIADLENKLCPGDRMEFQYQGLFRYISAHWCIYVGRYKGMRHAVIHFGLLKGGWAFFKRKIFGIVSSASQRQEIEADTIEKILGGSGWVRINNSLENEDTLNADNIVELANLMHRCKAPIADKLLNNNCDHIMDLCRYSTDWSDQVFAEYSYRRVSNPYASANIADLEDEVCPGDRLEFKRRILFYYRYAHWGIYVGRYQRMRHIVIHFGMFEGGWEFFKKKILGIASAASQRPEIRADTIKKVLGGSGWVRINNSRDNDVEHLNPCKIIKRAKSMYTTNTLTDYNLLSSNCEHFVNLCRYDDPQSEQADALSFGLRLIGMMIGAFLIAFVLTSVDDPVNSTICPCVLQLSSFCREYN